MPNQQWLKEREQRKEEAKLVYEWNTVTHCPSYNMLIIQKSNRSVISRGLSLYCKQLDNIQTFIRALLIIIKTFLKPKKNMQMVIKSK